MSKTIIERMCGISEKMRREEDGKETSEGNMADPCIQL